MRQKLPPRRNSRVIVLSHMFPGMGLTEWRANLGEYEPGTGRFGEVFLDGEGDGKIKQSSTLGLMANEGAILLSIALQHGATLDELRQAMTRDEDGTPHSVLGAVLDAMAAEGAPE